MKLVIQNQKIVALATDNYSGPDQYVQAPDWFETNDLDKYCYKDNQVVEIVPESISMAQLRLYLQRNNLLSNVVNNLNSIQDETVKSEALIQWEYSYFVERNNSLIPKIQSALNITDEQIDTIFKEASKI